MKILCKEYWLCREVPKSLLKFILFKKFQIPSIYIHNQKNPNLFPKLYTKTYIYNKFYYLVCNSFVLKKFYIILYNVYVKGYSLNFLG